MTVVASAVNTGFAGGVNLGVAAAVEAQAPYVFLLNNDATVGADTLGALVAASRECADDAVLGAVVRFKGTGDLQFFGSAQGDYDGGPLQCGRAIRRRFREARGTGFGIRRLDPTLAAMLIATRDYVLRRFGDCPPSVRALAARARAG